MTDHTRTEKIGGDSIFIFDSLPKRLPPDRGHFNFIFVNRDCLLINFEMYIFWLSSQVVAGNRSDSSSRLKG